MSSLAALLLERRQLRRRCAELDALIREARQREHPAPRPPLTRPDGSDPEGFSRRVAEAYKALVGITHRPAPLLAAEAGVPVTTVHRWIVDARRRGFLPQTPIGRVSDPEV